MSYQDLIQSAIKAVDRAVIHKGTPVGVAVLMNDGSVIQGFNIESRGFPNIHAEVVAIISCIKMGYIKNDYKAIAIVYAFPGLYPACASCRQFLWEHTNPDLEVIAFDISTGKGQVFKLKDLYPFPFPAENYEELLNKITKPIDNQVIDNETDKVTESAKEAVSVDMREEVRE